MEDRLTDFLQETLGKCNSEHFDSPESYLEGEQNVLNNFLLDNEFLSIFDLRQNEFTFAKNVENVLGYSREEFTSSMLLSSIPPLELFLSIQYAFIAFELMASGYDLQTLKQAYWVSFPFYKKGEKSHSRLLRKCQILGLSNGIPSTILDVWEDVTYRENASHVKWALFAGTQDKTIELCKVFFKKWRKRLGVGFSPRELQTLVLGERGLPAKEIADIMGVSQNVVEEYFGSMKKKVRKVAERFNSDRNFTMGMDLKIEIPSTLSRKELTQLAYTFGMLPDNILKQSF